MKVGNRELLIRLLRDIPNGGFLYERAIPRMVASSRRRQVMKELSLLLSEGFINRLGTGKRGDPHRIVLSAIWPFNKCPLCGHVEYPTPPSV